ncbi:cell wall-active antibiotics response protein LiaF [Paenibacillus sediminis]|uniref:Lia operon protein LiaF n=1 Tax=Paenibacillus sediminis TaxID=664909 RepID=A0ABS4H7W9_9BACL|nr:cell wall-active antibiotics response protein LiaF [Paenibacillus sediminis]MBP1938630.1 lia operon protein LiaF [Paenibacillus sediminis]
MRSGKWSSAAAGLFLIGIGAIIFLNQFNIVDISIGSLFATYWPVFLIMGGISSFCQNRRASSSSFGGLLLIVFGVYFLGRNLGFIDFSIGSLLSMIIPLLFITGGIYLLFKPRGRNHYSRRDREIFEDAPPEPISSDFDSTFNHTMKEAGYVPEPELKSEKYAADHQHRGHREVIGKSGFIGDVHIGSDYFPLKPMNLSHFIGDFVIDLTKAQIPYGETKLNISAFIGDVRIFVPNDMNIGISVNSNSFVGDIRVLSDYSDGLFGHINTTTTNYSEKEKKVHITISVFIGDVKVNTVG